MTFVPTITLNGQQFSQRFVRENFKRQLCTIYKVRKVWKTCLWFRLLTFFPGREDARGVSKYYSLTLKHLDLPCLYFSRETNKSPIIQPNKNELDIQVLLILCLFSLTSLLSPRSWRDIICFLLSSQESGFSRLLYQRHHLSQGYSQNPCQMMTGADVAPDRLSNHLVNIGASHGKYRQCSLHT